MPSDISNSLLAHIIYQTYFKDVHIAYKYIGNGGKEEQRGLRTETNNEQN